MSDQPKPTTGEWTRQSVVELLHNVNPGNHHQVIAEAHNAALAAANEDTEKYRSNCLYWKKQLAAAAVRSIQDMEKVQQQVNDMAHQLAAERESYVKQREDWIREIQQLQGASHHMEACRALLNVPDDEVLYEAIQQLREQLSAEREKVQTLVDALEHQVKDRK